MYGCFVGTMFIRALSLCELDELLLQVSAPFPGPPPPPPPGYTSVAALKFKSGVLSERQFVLSLKC